MPHSHTQSPQVRNTTSERANLRLAILFTTTILIAEVVGGLLSNSLALLSDAGHMLIDSVSLVLSFIALGMAGKPVTEKYTYGLRRIEILAALLNGVTLLIVCAYIIYEGFERLNHPRTIDVPVMMAIAAVGIIANIVSAILLRASRSLNVRSAFLHVIGDLFSSIGVVIAGMCMLIWDVPWLDPALSITIALVVLFSAYRFIKEAVGVLMEAVPENVDLERIRKKLLESESIIDVHDLHVWTITSGLPALSCHITVVDCTEHDRQLAAITTLLREEFDLSHSTIQIETVQFNGGDNICESC